MASERPIAPDDTADTDALLAQFLERYEATDMGARLAFLRQTPDALRLQLADRFRELDDEDASIRNNIPRDDEAVTELYLKTVLQESGAFALDSIGKYPRGKPVARAGGMGEAFLTEFDGRPAVIKVCRCGPIISRQIRAAVQDVRKLTHPNIVAILDDGVDDVSCNYFYVMEYLNDGDLEEQIQTGRLRRDDYSSIACITAAIARGVGESHRCGMIHRDLKPRNIFLGQKDEVKIGDFDLRLRINWPPSQHNEFEGEGRRGTLRYHSPEQANNELPGPASEIYTIGTIMFEMLASEPFVTSNDPIKMQTEIRERPARERVTAATLADVPSPLTKIMLKCLEKKPDDRYSSADDLADDLDRFQANKPISLPPDGVVERAFWTFKRNFFSIGVLALIVFLLLFVPAYEYMTGSDLSHEAALVSEVKETNRYVAQQVAGSVLFQLSQYSAAVVETVQTETFKTLWREGDEHKLRAYFRETIAKYNSDPRMGLAQRHSAPTLASMFALNAEGHIVALFPDNLAEDDRHFPGRDYFLGAMQHARDDAMAAVHVSRVFKSHNNELYEFAISIPFRVTNAEKTVDGVLACTLTTDSTLGLTRLHDDNRKVALVLPLDPNAPEKRPITSDTKPSEYKVFLHPSYRFTGTPPVKFPIHQWPSIPRRGPGAELRTPLTEQEFEPDDDFRDPIGTSNTAYAGRWIAGFAQVGNTEMMVVVQQRYAHVIGGAQRRLWQSIAIIATTIVAIVVLVIVLVAHNRKILR
jgi:serine/threonine protein kinase